MYGMIHRAARQMVTEQLGTEVWLDVIASAGVDESHFISGATYGDQVTYALIDGVVKATGLEGAQVLRAFGRYWIKFAGESAFASVMDMAGENLPAFISNLNRMHSAVQTSLPDAVMPEFDLIQREGNRLEIRYVSDRTGLAPFVAGLLEGLLDRFELEGAVTFDQDDCPVIFSVTYGPRSRAQTTR